MASRMTIDHRLLRLAAAGFSLFAICAACTYSEGERAETGACPEGEVCSDATPTGLVFYGALPGENAEGLEFLRAVAMGGTQRLAIVSSGETPLGAVDVVSSAPWFLTVEDDEAPELGDLGVELGGLAEGDAHVRVLAHGSDELYDRVLIRVARVSTVDVTMTSHPTDDLRANEPASAVFRLYSNQGDRLVDEGMTITSEQVDVQRISWDCIDFVAPSDTDEVAFTLEAGHRRWQVTIPVQR